MTGRGVGTRLLDSIPHRLMALAEQAICDVGCRSCNWNRPPGLSGSDGVGKLARRSTNRSTMAVRLLLKCLFRRPVLRERPDLATDAPDRAHLLLLKQFLLPVNPERLNAEQWDSVLGEPTVRAIEHLLGAGLIAQATIAEKLEHFFGAAELRSALSRAGLRASGSKAELARKLAEERRTQAVATVGNIVALSCTERGRALALEAVARNKKEREIVEEAVDRALARKDFATAADAVVRFERNQVFPRGLNVKWAETEARQLAAEVEETYRTCPKILRGISEEALEAIRPRAAETLLWGESRPRQKLETGGAMSGEVAARMLIFATSSRRNLSQMQAIGVVKVVNILSAEDSCGECRRLSGRQYSLRRVPELPHPDCTHAMGCRCCYLPVT